MNCFVNVYESISSVSLSELTKGKGRTQEERVLKSYTEQEFWRCFADGLNQSLVSSVAQAAKTLKDLSVPSKFTEVPRVELSGN